MAQPPHNFLRLLMKRPKRQSRRISKHYAKKVRRYSQQVGTIMWAWNRIHAAFTECFVELVDPTDEAVGFSIWHAIKADSGQRDMLKAVTAARTKINCDVSKNLIWLLGIVGKLSTHRNDVVHTPMMSATSASGSTFEPDPFTGDPAKVSRLERADREKFHKALTGDLIALSDFATVLAMMLRAPTLLSALPKRPLLQSLDKETQAIGPKKHRKRPQPRRRA